MTVKRSENVFTAFAGTLTALREALEERAGSGEKERKYGYDLSPDQYRAKTGKCPPGWRYDMLKKRCYQVSVRAGKKFDEPGPQSIRQRVKSATQALKHYLAAPQH